MMDWEWIDSTLMSRVRTLKAPRGRGRYLDTDERKRLLKAWAESIQPALYTVVVLALATGGAGTGRGVGGAGALGAGVAD